VSPLYFFLKNLATFLVASSAVSSLFIAFTQVSPSPGCQPTPFLPVRPRFSTIFCKFAHKIFSFGCHPLEGVTRGGPPPLVMPLIRRRISWQKTDTDDNGRGDVGVLVMMVVVMLVSW